MAGKRRLVIGFYYKKYRLKKWYGFCYYESA